MGTPHIEIVIEQPRPEELLRDASSREHNRSSASDSNSDGGNSVDDSRPRPGAVLHIDLELREADAALPIDLELHEAARNCLNRDDFGRALHKVSTEKHQPVAETVKSLSPARNTLVHTAALSRNPDVLAYLLEMYPQIVFEKNLRGDTALHAAAKSGFDAGICYILDLSLFREGPSLLPGFLRVKNQVGNTALHEALICGHAEVSVKMLEKDPQLSFYPNNEGKSPFYLAAETGLLDLVRSMLRDRGDANPDEMLKGESPLLAAVASAAREEETDILKVMVEAEPRLISSRDRGGRNMLHYAAYLDYLEGVLFLVGKHAQSAYQWDNSGYLPIHFASKADNVHVVEELFRDCPDPGELISANSENVLHVACWNGSLGVVKYMLKSSRFEELINQRNKDGNTPLHATVRWNSDVVGLLATDHRVNLGLTNCHGLTAWDFVESHEGGWGSLWRKRGTWKALSKAGAPLTEVVVSPVTRNLGPNLQKQDVPSGTSNLVMQQEMRERWYKQAARDFIDKNLKELVNTYLIVSTLVATVTFAASFTVPGGYNSSNPNQGMATLLHQKAFQVFIFCDTLAFYSSISAMLTLIFAQVIMARDAIPWLEIPLKVGAYALVTALLTMSMAFLAGTFLVVSILKWLSICLLVGGVAFVVGFCLFSPRLRMLI